MSAHEPKEEGRRVNALPVAVLAILIGIAAWWFLREPAKVSKPVIERADPPAAVVEAPSPPARKPLAPIASAHADKGLPLPVHPAGTASADQLVHPHPITPEHERLYRENALIGELNNAMDAKDPKRMRRFLAEYRAEYPEDDNVMQDGYQLVIDCFESPGEATRAAARKYWDTELASGLRRYIRRHCLEN